MLDRLPIYFFSVTNRMLFSLSKTATFLFNFFHKSSLPRRHYNSKMRFVQYVVKNIGTRGVGVELGENGNIVNLSKFDSSLPSCMKDFIACGPSALSRAQRLVLLCIQL